MILCAVSVNVQAQCSVFDKYIDNKNGTVTDGRSGLIWKRCSEGLLNDNGTCSVGESTMNWFEAMQTAKDNRFLGKTDWRIPTISELARLLHDHNDCINKDGLSMNHWSTSSNKSNEKFIYVADFSDGYTGMSLNRYTVEANLILVRSNNRKTYSEFNREYAKVKNRNSDSQSASNNSNQSQQSSYNEVNRRASFKLTDWETGQYSKGRWSVRCDGGNSDGRFLGFVGLDGDGYYHGDTVDKSLENAVRYMIKSCN